MSSRARFFDAVERAINSAEGKGDAVRGKTNAVEGAINAVDEERDDAGDKGAAVRESIKPVQRFISDVEGGTNAMGDARSDARGSR